jgi:hypothetical protein
MIVEERRDDFWELHKVYIATILGVSQSCHVIDIEVLAHLCHELDSFTLISK